MPHWFYTYFVHVLSGKGYQFWSGIGSDVGEVTLLGLVAVWWRTHNCHVHRCWRLSWHPHPVHGHPVCRRHYPNARDVGQKELQDEASGTAPPPGRTSPAS